MEIKNLLIAPELMPNPDNIYPQENNNNSDGLILAIVIIQLIAFFVFILFGFSWRKEENLDKYNIDYSYREY